MLSIHEKYTRGLLNAISPGPIDTRAASGIQQFQELLHRDCLRSPLQRLTTIESVGNLAAFLISDAASDVTGQTYVIDAGASMVG